MPSSDNLRLTTEARADLVDLLQSASQAWGEPAMNHYAKMLIGDVASHDAFANLRDPRDEIAEGIFECSSGQHIVFYTADDDGLTVLRIVHVRRDVKMLLGYL